MVMDILSLLIIAFGLLSIFCLLLLHFLSSEFHPSWRMISEYALGKHKWLITLFFYSWGFSTMLLAVLLFNTAGNLWVSFGLVLIFISGLGAIMGGLFDVKHKLHGLAFLLGVPTLPIGALLVSYDLIKNDQWAIFQSEIILTAHLPWISVILMAVSMMLLFAGFKKSGIDFGPDKAAPETLPKGVIGINGYMNRFLVLTYIAWVVLIAKIYYSLL